MTAIQGVHVTEWGASGSRVLLIHGGTPGGGADAFRAQEPLRERWRLILPDRPAHGASPRQGDEDFERDAALLAPLLKRRTHLVGQSYGGLVALYMAVAAPEHVASLTLIETPAFCFAPHDPAVVAMAKRNRALLTEPPGDPVTFMRSAFDVLGINVRVPDPAPEFLVEVAKTFLAEALQIRSPDEARIDAAVLATAGFPVLTLTSGRVIGFDHIAAAIADQLGGTHVTVPGTDHLVQNAGEPVNELLEALWRSAAA
jgi:pimeloyl-ACP methyl ester carboxylesterase